MSDREVIEIDADRIIDWSSFHDAFAQTFGFPAFYGRNMNAWIDCMRSLRSPDEGMTGVQSPESGPLTLLIRHARSFEEQHPDILRSLLVCAGLVNGEDVTSGRPPSIVVALDR